MGECETYLEVDTGWIMCINVGPHDNRREYKLLTGCLKLHSGDKFNGLSKRFGSHGARKSRGG